MGFPFPTRPIETRGPTTMREITEPAVATSIDLKGSQAIVGSSHNYYKIKDTFSKI
jgi:hypothetical protein